MTNIAAVANLPLDPYIGDRRHKTGRADAIDGIDAARVSGRGRAARRCMQCRLRPRQRDRSFAGLSS